MFSGPGLPVRHCGPFFRAAAAALCILLSSLTDAWAVNRIEVLALTRDKAILRIDGERQVVRVGERTESGILLVSADTYSATIECDGVVEEYPLAMVTTPVGDVDEDAFEPDSVTLYADSNGFFHADGEINGYGVRFLIDTGANTVALSSVLANQIGIDISEGQRGLAATASGTARMVRVILDEVSVGGIVLSDVEAGIIMGNYPRTPLLGSTFLNALDMRRDGNRMQLMRRN